MENNQSKLASDPLQDPTVKPAEPPKCYVKTSKNHTFTPQTIVPIIRNVKINDYCYAIYSTLHKIPLAVHEFLDKSIVQGEGNRNVSRDFKQQIENVDPEDLKFYPDESYYVETKAAKNLFYDKGHMAPAKNYCGQQTLVDSTFTFANCVPQNSYFNRGTWKNLQSYARNIIRKDMSQTIEVISGPVFYSGNPYFKKYENVFQTYQVVMMENGIIVPPKCYKIIKANVGNQSYASAFVFDNKYLVDNAETLKSHVVSLDTLEMMTGLRFNLGKFKPLEELDPAGMAKTLGDLHLEFYTKLFSFSTNLAGMSGARKQGFSYHVQVDIKCIPDQQKFKMAQKDFESAIKLQKARARINTLLGLHRDAYDLKILSEEFKKKIEEAVKANIEPAKLENEKRYAGLLSKKVHKDDYPYPEKQQLKILFPKIEDKTEKEQDGNDQTPGKEEEDKGGKKPKYTPKKEKRIEQNLSPAQFQEEGEDSNKLSIENLAKQMEQMQISEEKKNEG